MVAKKDLWRHKLVCSALEVQNELVCIDMAIFYLKNRECDKNVSKFKSKLLVLNIAQPSYVTV